MTTEATNKRQPTISDASISRAASLCVRECDISWKMVGNQKVAVIKLENGGRYTAPTNTALVADLIDRLTNALDTIATLEAKTNEG